MTRPSIHTLTVFQSINLYLAEVQRGGHAHRERAFGDGVAAIGNQNLHAALKREKPKYTAGSEHTNLVLKPASWTFYPPRGTGLTPMDTESISDIFL